MKLRASTLIESILSLLLISISFGVSIITFISVLDSDNLHKKECIHQIIRSIAINTETGNKFVDDSIMSKDSITYIKTIYKINTSGLTKLKIVARDEKGNPLEEYNKFVIIDEEN